MDKKLLINSKQVFVLDMCIYNLIVTMENKIRRTNFIVII